MNTCNEDATDLLKALETIGERPPPDLINAILAQGAAVVPGLLEMLERDEDEAWGNEDPRWFRATHAGLLLAEMAEPRALPALDRLYRNEERVGDVSFWLDSRLARFAEAGLAMIERIFNDPDIPHSVRVGTIISLTHLVKQPALRARVIPLLRSVLPPTQHDGTPDYSSIPGYVDEIGYEYVEPWTWAVGGLMHARDLESRERILLLYDDDMIDTWVVDQDAFSKVLEEPPADPTLPLLDAYYREKAEEDEMLREKANDLREQLERFARVSEIKEEMDFSDEEMEELFTRLLDLTDEGMVEQVLFEMVAERRRDRLVLPPTPSEQSLRKIGRNERVLIQNPDTGETMTLKFKHAHKKLNQGWALVERAE